MVEPDTSTYLIGAYETTDTHLQKENCSSETGSNDPYQFRQPKYYQHKTRARPLNLNQNEGSMSKRASSHTSKNSMDQQIYAQMGESGCLIEIKKDPKRFIERTNSCRLKETFSSLSSQKRPATRKNTQREAENDEEIRLFLEAEKEAQEAYLKEPVRPDDIRGTDYTEKSNLANVLNNQLINRQTRSEQKERSNDLHFTYIDPPIDESDSIDYRLNLLSNFNKNVKK